MDQLSRGGVEVPSTEVEKTTFGVDLPAREAIPLIVTRNVPLSEAVVGIAARNGMRHSRSSVF